MTLKGLRANANLTQEDVAKELQMTTLSYRRKEQGTSELKFSELLKLSKLFNISLGELVETLSEAR